MRRTEQRRNVQHGSWRTCLFDTMIHSFIRGLISVFYIFYFHHFTSTGELRIYKITRPLVGLIAQLVDYFTRLNFFQAFFSQTAMVIHSLIRNSNICISSIPLPKNICQPCCSVEAAGSRDIRTSTILQQNSSPVLNISENENNTWPDIPVTDY